MEEKPKPPPLIIGASGFSGDVYAVDQKHFEWQKLIHLPKYQMFAIEQSRMHYSTVMEWIQPFTHDQILKNGEEEYFNQYVKWHAEKKYWDKETVYGELI